MTRGASGGARVSSAPISNATHAACSDLAPARRFLVYPGEESYRLANDTQVTSLPALARLVAPTSTEAACGDDGA